MAKLTRSHRHWPTNGDVFIKPTRTYASHRGRRSSCFFLLIFSICLVTLGIVLGLVDFHFLLSILCVLLILSGLIRATISVFFVFCCPVLLSFCLVLSYMFELNKWRCIAVTCSMLWRYWLHVHGKRGMQLIPLQQRFAWPNPKYRNFEKVDQLNKNCYKHLFSMALF